MKTKRRCLTLTEHAPSAVVPLGRVAVDVVLTNPADDEPGTVDVGVTGRVTRLAAFAARRPREEGAGSYPAEVESILLEESETLLLLGARRVVVVKPAGDVCAVLHLFRSSRDDAGFHMPFAITARGSSVIVRYEGGIAAFAADGAVLWHTRLRHDDILLDEGEGYLRFSNEHRRNGEPWRLSLVDGSVSD